MLRIVIKKGGGQLDVDQNETISINLNYNETDIVLRKSSYSKTIKLPSTKLNDEFFSRYYNLDLQEDYSYNTKVAVDCVLLDDENVIIDGVIQLKRVSVVENDIRYEVVIFDKLRKLYLEVGDRTLRDLDLSEFSHERSANSILNSYNNRNYSINTEEGTGDVLPLGVGYRYPHVFQQELTDTSKVLMQSQLPALFYKTYIDKIFEENNFSYSSEFLNSDDFKSIILPSTITELKYDENVVSNNKLKLEVENSGRLNVLTEKTPGGTETGEGRSFDYVADGNSDLQTTGQSITVEYGGLYELNFRSNFQIIWDALTSDDVIGYDLQAAVWLRFDVYRNGAASGVFESYGETAQIIFDKDEVSWNGNYEGGRVEVSTTATVQLEEGDIVVKSIQLRTDTWYAKKDCFTGINCSEKSLACKLYEWNESSSGDNSYFEVKLDPNSDRSSNSLMNLNELAPNIKQKSLLTDMIKMFNLRVYPDLTGKTDFTIEPYDALFTNSSRGIANWSSKVDKSKEYIVKPNSFDYRTLSLSYTKGDTYFEGVYDERFSSSFGDCLINYRNDFTDKSNKFKSIFTSTPCASVYSDRIMPYFVEIDTDNVFKPKNGKYRLLFWPTKRTSCKPFGLYESLTKANLSEPEILVYSYPRCTMVGSLSNRDWDLTFLHAKEYYHTVDITTNNNIYNRFFRNYINQLTNSGNRLVEFNIRLESSDINSLDPTKRIFIDGNYYTVKSVNGWDKNKSSCKVTLIKDTNISNFSPQYFEPTNDSCPIDVQVKTGAIFSLTYEEFYSASGVPLSKSCCESYEGSIISTGQCRKYDPITTLPGGGGADIVAPDWRLYDWAQDDWRRYRTPWNTVYNAPSTRGSYLNPTPVASSWTLPNGYYNDLRGNNLVSFGNNNTLVGDNIFVWGSNKTVIDKPGFYIDDYVFKDGNFEPDSETNVTIINGGDNTAYDLLKTNDEDIIYGGVDTPLLGFSDVNRKGANYINGNAPFMGY